MTTMTTMTASGFSGLGGRLGCQLTTAAALDQVMPRLTAAGLALGFDWRGQPVTLRLRGGAATRVVLVGELRCTQLLALRAAGAGLHVVVRSPRLAAWGAFARAVNSPRELVWLTDPASPPQARPKPLAVIADAIPMTGEPPFPPEPAQAVLLVREELTTWDAGMLTSADAVILQGPSEAEAALAATTLGIEPDLAKRARGTSDTLLVVCQGSAERVWLQPTPVELDLIGPPARR